MEIIPDSHLGLKKKAALIEGPFFYPLHCIWKKTNKRIFSCQHGELAYEKVGRVQVVAGDPRAKTLEDQVKVYRSFVEGMQARGSVVCGYYFSEGFALASGQNAHKCGVSRALLLRDWSFEGSVGEEARRALGKTRASGLSVEKLDASQLETVAPLIRNWKESKGWVKIQFLLSEPEKSLAGVPGGGETVFVCRSHDDQIHAMVSMRRYLGSSHWYFDSLVQGPSGHKFAIDACIAEALRWLKEKMDAETVSFGFCPGIIAKPVTFVEKLLSYWRKTKLLYSPSGLYNFKRKYTNVELPRYLLLSPETSQWRQLIAMEVVTLFLRRN